MSTRLSIKRFIGLFFLFAAALAHAWPLTVGAEFEITTPEMAETLRAGKAGTHKFDGREREFRDKYKAEVEKNCIRLGCTVEAVKGKWDKDGAPDYLVTFKKNGWWFKISYDPWVIEIQTKPSTIEELREIQPLAEEAIFGSARSSKAQKFIIDAPSNSGHFNMGAHSAFDGPKSGQDFLRYFVDFANHPELALGVLGENLANGAPLSYLGDGPHRALKDVIRQVRRSGALQKDIRDVATLIQNQVYTESYKPEWGGLHHYQAFGMKHLTRGFDFLYSDKPFELRPVRGQKGFDDFLLLAELNELRIKYLNDNKPAIIYHDFAKRTYTETELASRFYVYVVEAGGDWEKFKKILPPNLQKASLDAFLRAGVPDWRKDNQIDAMSRHLPYFATSEFLRAKIMEAMKTAGATSPAGYDVLNRLIEAMKKSASREERKIYEDAIGDIVTSPTWANRNPGKPFERWTVKNQPHWEEARRLFPASWQKVIPKLAFIRWCALGFRNFFLR